MNLLEAAKAGKQIARKGWNGKGISVSVQYPDENSKMSHPYFYIDTTGLQTDNADAPKNLVPWSPSQTDLFAEDWYVVGAEESFVGTEEILPSNYPFEFDNYIGIKSIKAIPMLRETAELHLGRDVGGEATGEGYLVQYEGEDNYQAWSPKDVFEEAYHLVYPDGFVFDVDRGVSKERHEHRVVDEFDEAFDLTRKLAVFIEENPIFQKLAVEDKSLMGIQLKAMVVYRDVLYKRILRF